MESYRLLWAALGPDRSIATSKRGKKEDPTIEETMECLDNILGGSGLVELIVAQPSEVGPRGLQVRTDEGRSVITLAEVDDKKEKNIRAYRSGEEGAEVEILGDRWKSQMVCEDKDIVRQVFTELLSSGDVSRELLR